MNANQTTSAALMDDPPLEPGRYSEWLELARLRRSWMASYIIQAFNQNDPRTRIIQEIIEQTDNRINVDALRAMRDLDNALRELKDPLTVEYMELYYYGRRSPAQISLISARPLAGVEMLCRIGRASLYVQIDRARQAADSARAVRQGAQKSA